MHQADHTRIRSEELRYDPARPEAWTPERHQQFYDALKEYVEWSLYSELAKSDSENYADCDFSSALELMEIALEEVIFPPQKAGWLPDYSSVFAGIGSINFSKCRFYSRKIDIGYPTHYLNFKNCIFHEPWEPSFSIHHSQEDPLFTGCTFESSVAVTSSIPYEFQVLFSECDIGALFVMHYHGESLLLEGVGTESIRQLHIQSSTIKQPLRLAGVFLDEIQLEGCTFESKVEFAGCMIESLEVSRTEFRDVCDFSGAVIRSLSNVEVDYVDFSLFESCCLGYDGPAPVRESLDFSQVTFHKAANFRDAIFLQQLDLRNSVFLQTPTFLGSHFKAQARQKTDRETFRIIKQSFISVSNQIEADRFYAYEMQSYHNELRRVGAGQWRERILLGFNNAISSHGQNYFRAAGWLVLCMSVIALVLANDKIQWLPTDYPGPVWWQTLRDTLNGFAQGFLPLGGLYAEREHLAFFLMLATFVLSAISWHLLVAIRRHRHR